MIDVVAAIIRNKDGNILIAKRNYKKSQGGLWEFPGGKIEPGETKENALKREIYEEMNMEIEVIDEFARHIHRYPDKEINLIALNCKQLSDYILLEHEAVEWLSEDEFDNYEFAPADKYFVKKIQKNKYLQK